MKFLIVIAISCLSLSAFAKCKEEARNIAEEAVRLFNVNDQAVHCMAAGGLKSLKPIAVIAVMPPRYAFEAIFTYPCGPQPKSPKVNMLLSQSCKIVNLQVTGFQL